MEIQQRNIQMQSQANAQSAQAASQGRMQEQQMKSQMESEFAQMKSQLEMQKMQAQKEIDKELLQLKHQFEVQLKQMEKDVSVSKEKYKEDRKDSRTDKQATQQSKLIRQRKQDLPPVDFTQPGNANEIMNNLAGTIAPENV